MLFKEGDRRVVKVVDFGIAGRYNGEDSEKSNAGTIRYMPPELLSGDSNMADPSIDVWAIGIMMFMLLTGEYPFKGETSQEIKKAIIE